MSAPSPAPRRPRTAAEVQTSGVRALVRSLGAADAARFLQQVGPGRGDYTAERDALLGDLTMDEALRLVLSHQPAEQQEPDSSPG